MDQDTLSFLEELENEQAQFVEANEELVQTGKRKCPICSEQMHVEVQHGVRIDACEQHGIWLDRGELSNIVSRIRSGQRINRQAAVRKAKRDGKISGAYFGVWSLMFD